MLTRAVCLSDVVVTLDIFHFLVGHKEHAKNRHFLPRKNYKSMIIYVVDHEHANEGSQCSSAPTYTFVVHNVVLY